MVNIPDVGLHIFQFSSMLYTDFSLVLKDVNLEQNICLENNPQLENIVCRASNMILMAEGSMNSVDFRIHLKLLAV